MMKNSSPEDLFGERLWTVHDLLPVVQFLLLPMSLLEKFERSNLRRHTSTFSNHVEEAINYIKRGLQGQETSTSDLAIRSSSTYVMEIAMEFSTLQALHMGHISGLILFWPRITITASSPPSRFTDPKVLVSRTYQGTSFAGPQIENGWNYTWWMVDIGAEHQLVCNYYTLRHDGSRAYMRSWNFQGSLDGKTRTNLRVQENDQTICKPGQFASWPVTGPNALLPFRFFRVLLTGPTIDASNPWNISICFFELYGYFH